MANYTAQTTTVKRATTGHFVARVEPEKRNQIPRKSSHAEMQFRIVASICAAQPAAWNSLDVLVFNQLVSAPVIFL